LVSATPLEFKFEGLRLPAGFEGFGGGLGGPLDRQNAV
jgi:hypothetical protein